MEDINDWELLHSNSGGSSIGNSSEAADSLRELEELDGGSDGVIRSDYFSLESEHKYADKAVAEGSEEGSVGSDNPSWIEPGSENQYQMRSESGGFWSDSGSDERSDSIQTEGNGGGEGLNLDIVKLGDVWSDSGGLGFKGLEKDEESRINELDEGIQGSEIVDGDRSGVELEGGDEQNADGKEYAAGAEVMKSGETKEKRKVVWWKVPLELLKYCVFRVSPVWSFSVAAALLGFVIIGRRLYRMKRKAPAIQLKVTVDDKKVSQFMSRAARLNEAFSVVRRVPVIRPPLPAPGMVWPVMSLR